jgi:bifunctional DNase/RNase
MKCSAYPGSRKPRRRAVTHFGVQARLLAGMSLHRDVDQEPCRGRAFFERTGMGKELMEVKVMGVVVDPKASNPVVVLVDLAGQKALPIWIGVFEAEAISRGLEDVVTLRPMTHDLMKQILDTFQVSLTRVVINDLKENTFYANLYINVGGKELIVDSRPSDAIALAVRVKAPIFVAEPVIEAAKESGLFASNLLEEQDELKSIIENMKPEDFGKFKM